MTLPVQIIDGQGGAFRTMVTQYGQLVVAPLDYSTAVTHEMSAVDIANNFAIPKSGHRIVITDIILNAENSVGNVPGATVEIYEASSATSTEISKCIITIELIKNATLPLIGLNLLTSPSVWLNAKTDDATVNATVMFYYVPKDEED